MSTATTVFRCKECRKQFKGSEARAAREICRDCEMPLDLPEPPAPEANSSPVRASSPVEFVEQYQNVKRFANFVMFIAEMSFWLTAVPLIFAVISLSDKRFSMAFTLTGVFVFSVVATTSWWLFGNLVRMAVDAANNLQRIADRE